jgi:hypothetical protein
MSATSPVPALTAAQGTDQSGSKGVCGLSLHANSQELGVGCCGMNNQTTGAADPNQPTKQYVRGWVPYVPACQF